MSTTADALTQANRCHQAGDLRQAELLYRRVLEREPRHAEALHQLGVIAHQTGNHQQALDFMVESVRLQPHNPGFHSNLGAVLAALGRFDEALACAQQVVRLLPGSSEAHVRLGHMLEARGEVARAVESYREAVRLEPASAAAHYSLGNGLLRLGDPASAVHCYVQAVQLQPRHAEAHSNLGVALFDLGRMRESASSYHRALRARPEYPEALNNLGNALKELGHLDEAIAKYEDALRLRPEFADAHANLANALTLRGQLPEALESYRRALALRPGLAWARSNYLLCLNYHPAASAPLLFKEHRRWGELHGAAPRAPAPHRNDRDPERPLRVGYLAAHFQAAAFACFVQPVLDAHDPTRVQPVCYQLDPVSKDRRGTWRSIRGRTPAEVADLILADDVDILVDLLGHTRGHSLAVLPYRPAPVQVTWLGYPNTTGLTCVDYRLTDAVADPPGEPVSHTEELVRLPTVFCCYAPVREAPTVASLPAQRTGRVTFGSHHNLAKLNPAVLDLWSRVLAAVPGSRLLVFRDTLRGSARERLLGAFGERGIDADRIDFRLASAANSAHLELYSDVDIVLDSFPWSGHTTTCDALWMGVPVLTLRGARHASRMAASMLTAVELPEYIAESEEEFVRRGRELAQDMTRLAGVRKRLRERMAASPLCAAASFTRGLEDVFRAVWRRWAA